MKQKIFVIILCILLTAACSDQADDLQTSADETTTVKLSPTNLSERQTPPEPSKPLGAITEKLPEPTLGTEPTLGDDMAAEKNDSTKPSVSLDETDETAKRNERVSEDLPDLNGELLSHDFDDGTLGTFYPCTVKNPNYAAVTDGRVKTYWIESSFDGSRMTKGAEFCDLKRGESREGKNVEEMRTVHEGWMGFTLNVDRNHSKTSDSAIAQVFGFDDSRNIFTWEGLLQLENGDLRVVHRPCKCERKTYGDVVKNFEYGKDHAIVVGFRLSANQKGMFKVWVDGELQYDAENINFGLGEFDNNDMQTNESYTTFKLGQYNHSDTDYSKGEERIIYYDNVTWYAGTDGYKVVEPS